MTRSPQIEILIKLADYYKVSTDYIKNGDTTVNDKKEILIGNTNRDASKEAKAALDAEKFLAGK